MTDKTTFDPAGLCKTRTGLPVRIVCTDRRDRAFPYIGLCEDGSGEGVLCITADGRCAELPEGVDEWPPEGNPNDVVNCTPDDTCNALRRRSSAQEAAPASPADNPAFLRKEMTGLQNLLKAIYDAPTMEGGYRILRDWARQFWPADPVALSGAATAPTDLTERAKIIAWAHWRTVYPRDICDNADRLWECLNDENREGYLSAARAVPAPVPEAWRLVPVEATPEMVAAAKLATFRGEAMDAKGLFRALLSAAPTPTPQPDPLGKVRQAIADYHYALDTRQHGGTAAHQAIDTIKAHLGITWEPGAEKARRSSTSTPDVPVAVAPPEPTPVRCGVCGWLGDATELGEEGECGGDENCTGRPAEITNPADMLKAWQDSEGQICGKALAKAGLIEPKPATPEEAERLELEPGDTVWAISDAGYAVLRARNAEGAPTPAEEA